MVQWLSLLLSLVALMEESKHRQWQRKEEGEL